MLYYADMCFIFKVQNKLFKVFPLSSFNLLSAVLLKFRTDKGRDPEPQSFAEDSELLRQIRDDVLEGLAVGSELLSDDFIRYKLPLGLSTTDVTLTQPQMNKGA